MRHSIEGRPTTRYVVRMHSLPGGENALRALNVELTDEPAEAASPILLSAGSCQAGTLALPDGDRAA